jgi:ketosteroid isomerase-like protein
VRTLIFLVLTLRITSSLAAQVVPDTSLVALEKEWNTARIRGDSQALDALLDSGWTMIHVDGRLERRDSYLNGIASGARQIQIIVTEEQTIHVRGNVGIVSGVVRQRGSRRGEVREGRLRFTHVWIRDGARWRMLVSHSTELLGSTAK